MVWSEQAFSKSHPPMLPDTPVMMLKSSFTIDEFKAKTESDNNPKAQIKVH